MSDELADKDDLDGVWEDDGADPLDEEPDQPAPQPKPARLPRSRKHFAMVPLSWLTNRAWDSYMPARQRLFLYLQYKSRRGTRSVRLSNAMAAEIGLDRHSKMRRLRQLETDGLVTFTLAGRGVPVVIVTRPSAKLQPRGTATTLERGRYDIGNGTATTPERGRDDISNRTATTPERGHDDTTIPPS